MLIYSMHMVAGMRPVLLKNSTMTCCNLQKIYVCVLRLYQNASWLKSIEREEREFRIQESEASMKKRKQKRFSIQYMIVKKTNPVKLLCLLF